MKSIIQGTIILIYLLIPYVVFSQTAGSAKLVVQGTVTEKLSGETLAGATVVEQDNTNRIVSSTITDVNGHYVINIKKPENTLIFSFIGFITQTKPIGSNRVINVSLEGESTQIGEVVVKAEKNSSYGGMPIPKREISSAIQTISIKSLEGSTASSIDEALQGRVSGLDIVASSGDLGAGNSMRIRGISSINGNTQPLIVVNNVIYEGSNDPTFEFSNATQEQFATLLSVNPSDIEEISVLKDASSAAIWGSRGANGVISIKTKRGTAGPTRFEYSYKFGMAKQPRGLNMLNGDDYSMMIKQAYFNAAQDENAANVKEFMYDENYSEYENFNNNTDWVKEVIQTGITQQHDLTVTGGGDRARFRLSGGYLNQKGTVIGQTLDRLTARSTLDYTISDRILVSSELSFTYRDEYRNWKKNDWDWGDPYNLSLLGIAYKKMPNVSVYQQDLEGNNTDLFYNIPSSSGLNSEQKDLLNPVASGRLAKNNMKSYQILPTFRLQYDFLDPETSLLRYNMFVSFDVWNDKTSKYLPDQVSNLDWNDPLVNNADNYSSSGINIMATNEVNWQAIKNSEHKLLLHGEVRVESGNGNKFSIINACLPTDKHFDAASQAYLSSIGSGRWYSRKTSFIAQAHYVFLDRYICSVTINREGSTRTGKNYKYGNFPGISAKWIITDEPFMAGTKNWLSMLALRPGWGINGNQPSKDYLQYSRYSIYDNYVDNPAIVPNSLQLANLKWETTKSWNLGADLGFFDDRYVFDFNLYNKNTYDLLFPDQSIPSSSGFSTVTLKNGGSINNKGWEMNFYGNKVIKVNDFFVDFNFNLSNNYNKILKLDKQILDSKNADFDYGNGSYLTYIQNDNPYGSIYGFKHKGVYQYNDYIAGEQESAPVARDKKGNVITDENGEPLPMYFAYGRSNAYEFKGGDAIYEDVNHDGNIDELDIVYLGNSNPKLFGGFDFRIGYKGFSIRPVFVFRYGGKNVNLARMWAENMYSLDNQSKAVNWRWRKDGDVTEIPRALYQTGYNWLGSDRFVEDASYCRFKYMVVSYALPRKALDRMKLQQLTFNLTINNIYTWTRYTGVDPEVSAPLSNNGNGIAFDRSSTPRAKDATLTISVTF
jgi:TonB-linked SusC/RagA family outer membrane protein